MPRIPKIPHMQGGYCAPHIGATEDIKLQIMAAQLKEELLTNTEALRGPKGDAFTYADFTAEQLEALKVKGDPGIGIKRVLVDKDTPAEGIDTYTIQFTDQIVPDQAFQVRHGKDGQTTAIRINNTLYTHHEGVIELPNFATEAVVSQKIEEVITKELKKFLEDYYTKEETEAFVSAEISKLEIPSSEDFATKTYVDEKFNSIEFPDNSNIDFSNYYNKTETNDLIAQAVNSIEIPEPDLSAYSPTTEMHAAITSAIQNIQFPKPDLTGYATETWVQNQNFLTEHQDLSNYATIGSVEHQIDQVKANLSNYSTKAETTAEITAAIKNIEFPKQDEVDLTGFATTEWVQESYVQKSELSNYLTKAETEAKITAAIAGIEAPPIDLSNYATLSAVELKANEIPFTSDRFVTIEQGSFSTGDSVKGLTIAEILAKLLGLSNENTQPDAPEVSGIVESIISNELSMWAITEEGVLAEVPYNFVALTEQEATEKPENSVFYQLKKDTGEVEYGYQQVSTVYLNLPYMIALPKIIDFATNIRVQSWDEMASKWIEDSLTLKSDLNVFEAEFGQTPYELYPEIDPEQYTIWYNLEAASTGIIYRFIIKE